ncbi:hypothetical protein K461DRAFT_34463 [Myriangium duriaei CBS 260.36]|uniref:Uncharacterized protein n=1 Tax=Myriangium duriaei CBS 260.36 TaxID=1168546 RepID=A0A9P4MJH8_9PEZI|nr:hypothetical protein K461DRAFT_34463 [Myriangium duriaei CBS 260.36]
MRRWKFWSFSLGTGIPSPQSSQHRRRSRILDLTSSFASTTVLSSPPSTYHFRPVASIWVLLESSHSPRIAASSTTPAHHDILSRVVPNPRVHQIPHRLKRRTPGLLAFSSKATKEISPSS